MISLGKVRDCARPVRAVECKDSIPDDLALKCLVLALHRAVILNNMNKLNDGRSGIHKPDYCIAPLETAIE